VKRAGLAAQSLAGEEHGGDDAVQHGVPGHQLSDARRKPASAHLTYLQTEPPQNAADAELDIQQLGLL
jgi:hypothetical protein